jgi:hypothetical protein
VEPQSKVFLSAIDPRSAKPLRPYAQLLAGEIHFTELNKDLVDELVAKGYKLIRSRQVAQQIAIIFGGLYFGTADPQAGRYSEHGGPRANWT